MEGTDKKYSLATSVYKGVQAPVIVGVIAALLPIVTHGRITPEVAGGIGLCVVGVFQGVANWFKNHRQ